jgi:glycosyltransferase involved in cell wall biosynthesis
VTFNHDRNQKTGFAMRVIQLITAFQLGGAETVACNLAVGLADRGHHLIVASIRKPGSVDAVGEEQKTKLLDAGVGVRELAIGAKALDMLVCPIRLASLYRNWNADVVHAHTDIPDFMVSLAARLKRDMRIARTIHNTELWHTHNRLGRLTETGLTREMVIYLNGDTLDAYIALRRRYGLEPSTLRNLIKSGIPRQRGTDPIYDRSYLVEHYKADIDKCQFGFAGRLTSQKGVDVLLKAVSNLPRSYLAKAQVHIFGDGEESAMVSQLVRDGDLPVFLHAPEPAVHRLFTAFDCMILPSRYEASPMVVIESLSQGVPIIVTSAPGLREAVPRWWPLVAASGDWQAIGSLMKSVIDGTLDLADLGQRGREWASREHSFARMITQHEDAYQELMDDGPTA